MNIVPTINYYVQSRGEKLRPKDSDPFSQLF